MRSARRSAETADWVELLRLRRQTSGRAYVPEIDGLRFVAIISVVLFHLVIQVNGQASGLPMAQTLFPFVHNGYRGVMLFFVISGFILGLPFARHRLTDAPMMRLRDYFLRRVTRLEPPYMVMMVLRAGLMVVVLHHSARSVLPHLLAGLGYVHSQVYATFNPINPPTWSLEIEIQFYCIAPLLAWLFFSLRRFTLLRRMLLLAAILIWGYLQTHLHLGARVALSIANALQYFLAGFLLCDLYLVGWEKIRSHWLWDAVCLPLWVFVFWSNNEWFNMWLPLACIVLYVGAFKGPVSRLFFRNPMIASTVCMCYSIYLTHNLVLTYTDSLLRRVGVLGAGGPIARQVETWLAALAIVLLVFGAGLIFYVLLERPCMERDWPQKLLARLRLRFGPIQETAN